MSTPTIARGDGGTALALQPGYADTAREAMLELRPARDAVDFVEVEHHPETASTVQLGFWVYLMSDCLLFSALFATYSVLHGHTAGGPSPRSLFDLPDVLTETMALLCSSFTCALATLAASDRRPGPTIGWLLATFALGLVFIGMEIHEFAGLVAIGAGPQRSAFLSSFFTLVATHGLHVTCGLIFMAIMMVQVLTKGFTGKTQQRLTCLGLFWHFLDIIWVGVFSIVYLFGATPR
jgi:cytochrome o ubiquinol oxidase subunit 3